MFDRIKFSDGTTLDCRISADPSVVDYIADNRQCKKIRVLADNAAAKAKFTGDAYSHEWGSIVDNPVLDEAGNPIIGTDFLPQTVPVETVESRDFSEYCIPGDIIDHRDGSVTVIMGKKTELELTQEALDQAIKFIGGE
jgi:hypothetical protein